jgi:hypothetical protein
MVHHHPWGWKKPLLWTGIAMAASVWGITLYWTLVARGILSSPWPI